jgi:hypothetical protein
MNKEYVILAKLSPDAFNQIMHEINSKISYVLGESRTTDRSKVCISIPNYFWQAINQANLTQLFNLHKTAIVNPETLSGCKIVPAFDNSITIYHVDTPLYKTMNALTVNISDYE